MRALIRIEIVDPKCGLPPRANRSEYATERLCDARHLVNCPSLPTQPELDESEEVKYLFEDAPDLVKRKEMEHLIMLGYTSEGQAKFVLCSINQTILHIRVRDDLFDNLRRACFYRPQARQLPSVSFAARTRLQLWEFTGTFWGRSTRRDGAD
jgi:hypothetical protein